MEKNDWRLKFTTTVTKDVPSSPHFSDIKKGDILKLTSIVNISKKKTLSLPVPSLTALYINTAQRNWNIYKKLRKKHKIDSSLKSQVVFKTDKDAFDALEALSTSIISAYTAIESFCNDSIPEEHEYWHHNKSDVILEKANKKKIERYFSTSSKLTEILPSIYNVGNPKGKSPIWVSYVELKRCRDSLIHAKSHETRSALESETNLWDKLFKIKKPHLLARDIFKWYLSSQKDKPVWFENYPK